MTGRQGWEDDEESREYREYREYQDRDPGRRRRRRPRRDVKRSKASETVIVVVAIVLFVLLAVLGIVAAFAVPAYQDYVSRTRVAEGLVLVSPYKNKVTEYYARHGNQFPQGTPEDIARQLGLSDFRRGSQNVMDIRVLEFGVIEIEYNPAKVSSGRKLLLVPSIDTSRGMIMWRCQNSTGSDAFRHVSALPAECRG